MCAQSKPYRGDDPTGAPAQAKYGLKIIVLSNEARELNDYRIHKFKLDEFVDAFVSSCLVRLHKPDAAIFRLALDIAMDARPANRLYRKHGRCLSKSRKVWGFTAFCTPITNPPLKNWRHSDYGLTRNPP
jgi:hypothetical protein